MAITKYRLWGKVFLCPLKRSFASCMRPLRVVKQLSSVLRVLNQGQSAMLTTAIQVNTFKHRVAVQGINPKLLAMLLAVMSQQDIPKSPQKPRMR